MKGGADEPHCEGREKTDPFISPRSNPEDRAENSLLRDPQSTDRHTVEADTMFPYYCVLEGFKHYGGKTPKETNKTFPSSNSL